jgi:hypothetical protein
MASCEFLSIVHFNTIFVQLAHLRLKVNEGAEQYDRICADFKELDRREQETRMPVETDKSDEDVFQFEEQDDTATLAKQKIALERELAELRDGFKHQKRLVKKREQDQLLCIKKLNAKYKLNQQTLEMNLRDASPIKGDITALIE